MSGEISMKIWPTLTSAHPTFRPAFFVALVALGGLIACSGASSSSPANATSSGQTTPTDVKVTLTDFRVDAPPTSFKVGVPYRFVVTNGGTVNHEFMVV